MQTTARAALATPFELYFTEHCSITSNVPLAAGRHNQQAIPVRRSAYIIVINVAVPGKAQGWELGLLFPKQLSKHTHSVCHLDYCSGQPCF